MPTGVRITSTNLSGKTATVTFLPLTGGTVNIGSKTIPFNYVADYLYGTYQIYVPLYDYTYELEVVAPTNTPTPTPTVTSTPTTSIDVTPTSTSTPTLTATFTEEPVSTSTPTLTPTLTSTPTLTETSTPTPTLTSTLNQSNFILENQDTSGINIQTIFTSFSTQWSFSFPLIEGQTGNITHSGINVSDTLSIQTTGSGPYSLNIYRNGVLLDVVNATSPQIPTYTFTTGFTTSDVLRVVMANPATPTPTPTKTATPTPTTTSTPTGTPGVTPTLTATYGPLNFNTTYSCSGGMSSAVVSGLTGGSGQYQISGFVYASEQDALVNGSFWQDATSLIITTGGDGTFWVVVRDKNNPDTKLAKSVVVNCSTPTPTPTLTLTSTPTVTPTLTSTGTPTLTPTVTSTSSSTPTVTPTLTSTSTPTLTPTSTGTPTVTPTSTSTPTLTSTNTPTLTSTPTQSSQGVTYKAYIFAEPQTSSDDSTLLSYAGNNGALEWWSYYGSGAAPSNGGGNYSNDLNIYAHQPSFVNGGGNFVTPVSLSGNISQSTYLFDTIQVSNSVINSGITYFYSIWLPLDGIGNSLSTYKVDVGTSSGGSEIYNDIPSLAPTQNSFDVIVTSGAAIPAGTYRVLWITPNFVLPASTPLTTSLYFTGALKS